MASEASRHWLRLPRRNLRHSGRLGQTLRNDDDEDDDEDDDDKDDDEDDDETSKSFKTCVDKQLQDKTGTRDLFDSVTHQNRATPVLKLIMFLVMRV